MAIKKQIQLSDQFNYGTLIRFTIPSIIMMLFTSLYSIVDGLFVSNFVGKTGFAAINLIIPALNILALPAWILLYKFQLFLSWLKNQS